MLIDFSATNFRSINGRQTFSMQTVSRIAELSDNVFEKNNTNLLRSAVIYGRNGSGKSNLLNAMDCLSKLASNAYYHLKDIYQPFKISLNKQYDPTVFEINFYAANGNRYFYEISFTDEQIIKENLYYYPGGKKARLFLRNQESIVTEIASLKDIYKITYPYHSLLSRLNLHKIEQLLPVYEYFSQHFLTGILLNEMIDSFFELRKAGIKIREEKMPYHIENLGKLMRIADTGIDSIEIKRGNDIGANTPDDLKKNQMDQNHTVIIKHPVYVNGDQVGFVDFDIDEESEGTKKLMLFGSKMLDALSNGDVLIVDELDKGLHPILMRAIIGIFSSPKANPNNAQLIFATHDVSLLSSNLFRRDQIYITEKNSEGETSIFTLADIKGVRADIAFDKYLLKGVFGGIPVVNEFDFEFNLSRKNEKE